LKRPLTCHTHVKIAALALRRSGAMDLLSLDIKARSQ